MFTYTRPTSQTIQHYVAAQQEVPFSYPHVGASRQLAQVAEAPWSRRYTIDHNRVQLGEGAEVFRHAKAALCQWEMFRLGWVHLCWPSAPIKVGTTVAVLARVLGLWSLNACRIVYTIDEREDVERFGFAYGTLPDHAEQGEERFSVEWWHADNTVWYDLVAFSRPQHALVRVGYWYGRHLQKRFAAASKAAMVRAVRQG